MQPQPQFVEPGEIQHQDAPDETQPAQKTARKRRRRKILLITLLVLVLLGGSGALAAGLYLHSVDSSIDRVDAFQNVPEASRPQKVVKNAMNILILGSDSRDPDNTSGSRSDTIIVAHIDRDHSGAQL